MPTEHFWTTRNAGTGDKILYWRRAVCEAVFELEVDVDGGDSFEASICQRALGPIALSRIRVSNEQTIHRTHSAIVRNRQPQFELVNMRCGSALLKHYGREVEVRTGESVLIDNKEQYTFTTSAAKESLSFHIPAGWLRAWIPNAEDMVARPISMASPWGAALLAAISAVSDAESTDSAQFHQLCASQLAGALALAVGPSENQATPHLRKLFLRLHGTLVALCHESGLDAGRVADLHKLSVRYLHTIFASANTTFSTELLRIRLEHAAGMLRDPRFKDLSMLEIAWRCGFCDASHFSRRFRQKFMYAPGAFRAALQN